MPIDNQTALQGNLDMLILRSLDGGAKHGYGVARHIQHLSDEALRIEEGSLYPALHRLEKRGLVSSEWGLSEANRRAKYYKLTHQGRTRLESEVAMWRATVTAIEKVLFPGAAGEGRGT
jgi:transcriptional regulator